MKFLSTIGIGRASVLGMGLTALVSMGACDDGGSSDAAACDPGAVCQCTKKSDCAATDDCVNNVCVPAGQTTQSPSSTTTSSGTTAGTSSTTGTGTSNSTTGAGGGAGADSTGGGGSAGEGGSGDTGGNDAEPSVVIVLDRSNSAAEDFDDGASRWEAIVTALTEEDGPVASNAGSLALGVLDYTGFNGGTCPEFGEGVDPELDNYAAVSDYVASLTLPEDKSETPTRQGIEQGVSMLSSASGPKALILITDGVTDDTCMTFDNANCRSQAYYAAQQAYNGGVRTYILGVSVFDDDFRQYLQGVANAGSGAPLQNSPEGCGPPGEQPETSDQGGTAPYWDANDTSEISSSLDEIFQVIRGG